MAHRTPGDLVCYRLTGSDIPPWPAVICTDDFATPEDLRNRPSGYVTLVLVLGEDPVVRWAQTCEMFDYDPSVPFEGEAMVAATPGLGEAYAVANSALEAGMGLHQWRSLLRRRETITIPDEEELGIVDEQDEDFDRDMEIAIQMSLGQYVGEFRAKREKPQTKKQSYVGTSRPSFTGESSKTPQKQSKPSITPRNNFLFQSPSPSPPLDKDHPCKPPASKRKKDQNHFHDIGESSKNACNSAPEDLLSRDRLGKITLPTSDTIDEDPSESNQYVRINVGPDREELILHKNSVWDRPYFRSEVRGIMLFGVNEDDMWELQHPALSEIDPEYFTFIAEYLESGSFGIRHPQDEEERNESFIQICSTWTTADKLGMTDLLDHIVERMEALRPWDLVTVLAFTRELYTSPESSLPAHVDMKNMLATCIAENYWDYIEDDGMKGLFVQRLKDFPELERDICVRRAIKIEVERNAEEDENEEDGEGDDDDVDDDDGRMGQS